MNDLTGILTSKDICALNRPGQYTTIERISAHESQQAELDLKSGRKNVSHKTQPTVPDSESSNRSVNQAGNTTVHYDRNKNANMAVSNRDQDIVEDAVPESTDASIGKFISHVIHFLHFNLNIKIQKSWE